MNSVHPDRAPAEYSEGFAELHTYDEELVPMSSRRSGRPERQEKKRRRRRTAVMGLTIALFAAVVVFVVSFISPLFTAGEDDMADFPGPGTGSVTIEIEQGAASSATAQTLVDNGVVASTGAFLQALRTDDSESVIQPGSYELKTEMSADGAVAALLDTEANAVHYAAVDQGLRQDEAFEVLAEASGVPLEDFTQLAEDPEKFGLPEQAPSLEGYLSPGQYRFPLDFTAADIIQMMVDKTFANLEKAGVEGADEQYRILTIASIIELEGNPENYAEISGAIQNRLYEPNSETNGRIQSDATVTYGLDRKSYELTAEEKADKSNPYNTYANAGLPIGPISSPMLPSIEAAANPQENPYYYWVTINLDTGETLYAETLAEHNQNVLKYVAWCEGNPGRCE